MDDSDFQMLFEILKILQREDLKGSNVSIAAAAIIDSFESQLSAEQKLLITKEFMKYMRKEKPDMPDYRRNIESYF